MMRRAALIACNILIINMLQSYARAEETEKLAENVPLTLFQLLSRADLVAHVRVKDGEGKYAIVEVLSDLKGGLPGRELRVDFRDLNLTLKGQEMVVFRAEEEYVLMLMRKHWRKPKESRENIVDLFHGRRGRLRLPAEGSGPMVDAVRQMVELTRLPPDEQADDLRALVRTDNLFLRENAMDEIIRLNLATETDLAALMRLLADPSPRIRSRALTLTAQVFRASDAVGATEDERSALGLVLERARNDLDETVRVESIRALGAWPRPADIDAELKSIAKQDTSQSVRYEAERLLFRMKP